MTIVGHPEKGGGYGSSKLCVSTREQDFETLPDYKHNASEGKILRAVGESVN